ncbi:SGNH/GDSL hydrolase family protein [Psychrobacter sp. MES7-P7E]|uniref:SGNH/GDSL hydrolase family protein n=1 Tax=Psychrobacter sp. MES7-P7E TaxID=2058322 RepID=UPI000C7F5EE9|nr:SGNH/GDSL hydrolase family protein [Psychrobacter sp. MES7-P7E]PLT21273.1 hypothetical protein CXF62_10890 [Psychrobacter sp. MES7-P7E]
MSDSIIEEVVGGSMDLKSMQTYVNTTNPDEMVERRLAPPVRPLQFWDTYFAGLANSGVRATIQSGVVQADKLIVKNKQKERLLFIGDSLTELQTGATYAKPLVKRLAPMYGGMGEFGYIPLTTSHAKLQGSGGQVSVSRTSPSTVINMWGPSDRKWDLSPYKYSPDGQGMMVDAANAEAIYITAQGLLKCTKARIFYLKQPNGCKFTIGFQDQPAGNRLLVDTQNTTEQLSFVDINADFLSPILQFQLDGSGKKFAAYGVQFIDDSRVDGITYDLMARSGVSLYEHNQLVNIETYYQQLKPTIAVINIGTNDAINTINRQTRAQFKSNFQTWVNKLRTARPDCRIYIVEPNKPEFYGLASDPRGVLLEQFTAVRKEIVAENTNIYFIDVPRLVGDYAKFLDNDWLTDAIHPNAIGKGMIASAVFNYMLSIEDTVSYDTIMPTVRTLNNLTPIASKVAITSVWSTIAKYGISKNNVNAYFDITVTSSSTGRQWTTGLKFYAMKTGQTGNTIFDVRGPVSATVFRYDAISTTTALELRAVKGADNYIEVQAKLTSPDNTQANEWTLTGTSEAAVPNFLFEM